MEVSDEEDPNAGFKPSEIIDKADLEEIGWLMKQKVGSPFTTNVLRIALNFKEEKIASTLVEQYEVCLDDRMIIRAVKTN